MPQQLSALDAPISNGYFQQLSGLSQGDQIEILLLPRFNNATVELSIRGADRSFTARIEIGNPYTPDKSYFEVHWSDGGGDRLVESIGHTGGIGGTPISLFVVWARNDAPSPIFDVRVASVGGPRAPITASTPLQIINGATAAKSIAIDRSNASYLPALDPKVYPAQDVTDRQSWRLTNLVTDNLHQFWSCPLSRGQSSQHYFDFHVSNYGARYSVMQFNFGIEWRDSDNIVYVWLNNPFTLRDDKGSVLIDRIKCGWDGGRYDLFFRWKLGAAEGSFAGLVKTISGRPGVFDLLGGAPNPAYGYGEWPV